MGEFINFIGNNLADFWTYTGFANATFGHIVMIFFGLLFIYLAVAKEFEPMLLIPIGFGILIGNIPFNMEAGLKVGIYEEGSVLNILYQGVTSGWYPPLIFLGIGAMTVNARRLLLCAVAVQAHPCVESGHLLLAQIIRRLLGTGSGHDRDDRHGPCNANCFIHS